MYLKNACVAQLAKASDSQSVGHGFELRLYLKVLTFRIGLNIIFRSDLI